MNKQVKDQWCDWRDVAGNFRYVNIADCPTKSGNVIFRSKYPDSKKGWGIVEFSEETSDIGGSLNESMAAFVFPNMTLPHLRRTYNMMAHRHAGLIDWINTAMEFPFLGIRTTKILYFATDSVTDYTLLKMKCDEYHPSM